MRGPSPTCAPREDWTACDFPFHIRDQTIALNLAIQKLEAQLANVVGNL